MKIIFLDIDGVLNSEKTCNLPPLCESKNRIESYLNPTVIEWINELANKHNAEIVMSTSWRLGDKKFDEKFQRVGEYANFDLKDFLQRCGLKAKFHEDWHTPLPERFGEMINGRPRGFEINDWLSQHSSIDTWVAIDDWSWGFDEENLKHLVQTDFKVGMTRLDFQKADKILTI